MSENDATVFAEALISTVARAFYEDVAIALVDVLIRDKFLRDDQDMGSRLSLPPKQLRKTLQFLQEEHIVKSEAVDDLTEGGSQATKFWYIDYNHAVKVIRLRLYLLQKQLEKDESKARTSSMYLCPGYNSKRCNGCYTETEVQQFLDYETGLFLCQECTEVNKNNPNAPPKETYTLQLQDNTKALRQAMDRLRRVRVQFSSKMIGNQQMRMGIFDLIQKIREKGSGPLTSNLPSENRMMNIGSKRIEGTGRTASVRIKKMKEKMGDKGGSLKKFLNTGSDDLTFLKNALGQQIAFEVEKGGGARANLLAKGGRSRERLLDAAAVRVGVDLDLVTSLAMQHKRKRQEEENEDEAAKQKKKAQFETLAFLKNNIGRNDEPDIDRTRMEDEVEYDSDDDDDFLIVYDDDDWEGMSEDKRRAMFQSFYKKEMARLKALANGESGNIVSDDGEDDGVNWLDG